MLDGMNQEEMNAMREMEKMQAGMWYDANYDEELVKARREAQDKYFEYNQIRPSDDEQKQKVLAEILGYTPKNVDISQPFYCDYGKNIEFGENVHVNLSCYFMDGAKIKIGSNVFIGPYTGFYTAAHANAPEPRNEGLEQARPITVGDNCWFGANVSVMPGVTIGKNCVISAGSVVTKDMPNNSVIMGVPAKAVREINEKDDPRNNAF